MIPNEEKANQIYRHGTTWCSTITCDNNKLTEPLSKKRRAVSTTACIKALYTRIFNKFFKKFFVHY